MTTKLDLEQAISQIQEELKTDLTILRIIPSPHPIVKFDILSKVYQRLDNMGFEVSLIIEQDTWKSWCEVLLPEGFAVVDIERLTRRVTYVLKAH